MKNITQALKVVALALVLSFGISYVYAWTAPTVTPPNGNVSAPINTSATTQYKEGALGIGGILRGYANAIFDGSVGVGITIPQVPLHTAGSINAPSNSATPNGSIMLGGTGTGVQVAMGVTADVTPQYGWIQPRYTNNNTNYNLVLNPNGGSVGIGVPIPSEKLDVAGNIKGTGLCMGTDCRTSWPTGGSGTLTSLSAGTGITLSPNPITTTGTISANTGVLQSRVTGSCAVGQAITAINADGTVTCASAGSIIGGLIPKASMAAVFGNKRTEVVSVTTSFGSNCSNADTPTIAGYCQMTADGLSSNYVLTSSGNTSATCGQITTSSALVTVRDGSCPARTAIAFWQ